MTVTVYRDQIEATKKISDFPSRIETVNKLKTQAVNQLASDMLARLDNTRHDARNTATYKMACLTQYYTSQGFEGQIDAAGWDDMFAVYTEYTGTY